jgi:allophanate hydrolase subunit 1
VPESDYTDINVTAKMDQNELEKVFEIPIVDNDQWEPDLDFLVEIYDCETSKQERMIGDDT